MTTAYKHPTHTRTMPMPGLPLRWRKVARDLWLNRTRTILVVLSIAVGVFAVGVIINAQQVLSSSLNETYDATNPAHANIMTLSPFDKSLADTVRNMPTVEDAEARRSVAVRVEKAPGEWINLQLMAIPDFEDIQVSKVQSAEGAWPPGNREILVERSALGMIGAEVGDTVTIKTPSGKEREVLIAGLSHDLQATMYTLSGMAYGHISEDMLEWMGESRDFNELHVRVAGDVEDGEYLRDVISDVQDKVEKSGLTVLFTFIQPPGQLPANYIVQAILFILGAVGLLSLVLSSFLVVNTVSAVLTQQVIQIGMMKAVGARTRQLIPMYLLMVLIYGVLALLVALPLGLVTAYFLTKMIGGLLNFDLTEFRVSRAALLVQVAIALAVPLIAGLLPILSGTRMTVREALASQGLGKGQFGTNWFDRFLTGPASRVLLRWVSRPAIISLRNTFRRKRRLIFTLITLVLGGTVFIAVASLQASLRSTMDSWLNYYQYDVAVQFARPYRVEQAKQSLMELPGVTGVEGFAFVTARRARPDGTESGNIIVFGPNSDTDVVQPSIVEGRWLLPEDENAIVLSTMALRDDKDIKIGDEIELKILGKEEPWQVVGFAQGGAAAPTAFASYDTLSRLLGQVGKADYMMVVIEDHNDAQAQTAMATVIEDHLTAAGFRIALVAPAELDKQTIASVFQIIFILLLVVSIVLATVGGLGLMGTMSINVLERTREIGVMRAVGASTRAILRIIVFEGMFIGGISWILGTLFAVPISRYLSDVVGEQLLSSTLDYTFSTGGMTGWLILVVVLAAVASLLPALNAARLTVREVLAYE